MAKLTDDDVLKLARLSRLYLTRDEIKRFKREISSILEYVEQLRAVDVSGLLPTHQVTGLKNVTRPDEVRDYGAPPDAWLVNAPATEGRYIKVKRVLE
jgi:aspartyl-tRNA(Asn)/glutamyl-tRNA(Gln) amidotransferase subunit C